VKDRRRHPRFRSRTFDPFRRTYKCEQCRRRFLKKWSDAEADAEALRLHGAKGSDPGMAVVCHTCWLEMRPRFARTGAGKAYALALSQPFDAEGDFEAMFERFMRDVCSVLRVPPTVLFC
jgi:hypothetical protein